MADSNAEASAPWASPPTPSHSLLANGAEPPNETRSTSPEFVLHLPRSNTSITRISRLCTTLIPGPATAKGQTGEKPTVVPSNTAAGVAPIQHETAPKPVFKMKRTGHGSLPQLTPIHGASLSRSLTPTTPQDPPVEPEPAKVVSDILAPQAPSTPAMDMARSDGTRKTKYANDEERRKATSLALKQRWASGRMDHVHQKRLETMRRKQEAAASIGSPGISKPSGFVGTPKHSQNGSTAPHVLSTLAGPITTPTHHAKKRTMVVQELARLLEDKTASTTSAAPASHHGPVGAEEQPQSTSDVEMVDSRPSLDQTKPDDAGYSDVDSEWEEESLSSALSSVGESEADDIIIDASATQSGQGSNAKVEPAGNAAALWDYLQPYLTEHKGPQIPTQGWVPQLITLPKIRDLDWNTRWLDTHPYRDSLPRDISALIIQVTGDPAPKPCSRCRSGAGLFRSCIMISAKASNGPIGAVFSCANCFYHFGQTRCSHKEWGLERATRILTSRQYAPEDPRESVANSNAEESVEDEKPGSAEAEIKEAEPGRLYTMWPDENGQLAHVYGALLPTGYQLDYAIPGRPWICPVRTCRKVFGSRRTLGYHFERAHYANTLNDNGDGTFSVKGVYNQNDRRAGIAWGGKILIKAPPIVVSKEPLDGSSPIPNPQLPSYLAAKPPPLDAEEKEAGIATEKTPEYGDPDELWAYLRPYVTTYKKIPANSVIRQLLTLPRRRDVQFTRGRSFIDRAWRDIAAMIMHVTGDEVSRICGRCREGKGLFPGCVVLPESAPPEVRQCYPCCANCVYQGRKLGCSLLKRTQLSHQEDTLPANGNLPPVEEVEADGHEPAGLGQADTGHNKRLRTRTMREQPRLRTRSSLPSVRSSGHPAPSSLISQGNFQAPDGLLEMEDWEVAPGRIREASAAGPETIAFSKPYLSTSSAVPVCDDVAFRVDTISSGNDLSFAPDPNKTRLCSVAVGKVRVKIGNEAEFVVGPHGMFKVKAGTACNVSNGLYLDAVLHTMVLMGYT
ncbi:hypothetical protein C8A03DRAFT_18267 [Achaetomium macrosporum]|uniref:C2H2-type domain-containing protein n=1 Tax=Achaetomium macrosporum TaxID=79813 RepID=A0AAN7C4J5_9PEZI|nr:hypothetical protein C8A03DRAFT_18267 [Achaetomium macrosporum]